MARQPRVTLNRPNVAKVARVESMPLLRSLGEQVLGIVGTEHYEMQEWRGRNRARVTIRTKDNWRSRGHEARHHNLVAALAQLRA